MKRICTASLFALIVGVLIAGWFVRMPDYLIRWQLASSADATVPGTLWVLWYVVLPILCIWIVLTGAYALWKLCDWACAKLRRAL